jgi:hypothetical protein
MEFVREAKKQKNPDAPLVKLVKLERLIFRRYLGLIWLLMSVLLVVNKAVGEYVVIFPIVRQILPRQLFAVVVMPHFLVS